jgi:hypothetical protein
MLKAFLSLPSIIILPCLFGFFMILPARKYSLDKPNDAFSVSFLSWLLGIYVLCVLAIWLQSANQCSLLFPILFGGVLFSLLTEKKFPESAFHINYNPKFVKLLIIASLIGVLPIIIASFNVPFPIFGLNHDLPRIIVQPTLRAINDNYFMVNTRHPEVLLSTFACKLYNIDPLSFAWTARFLLGIVFSIGIFLFIYEISSNTLLSLLSVLFGVFIMSGGSNPGVGGLFFEIPAQMFKGNSILYALFPYVLLIVKRNVREESVKLREMSKITIILVTILLLIFIYQIPENQPPFTFLGALPTFWKMFNLDPWFLLLLPTLGILSGIILLKSSQSRKQFLLFFILLVTMFEIHRENVYLIIFAALAYVLVSNYLRERLTINIHQLGKTFHISTSFLVRLLGCILVALITFQIIGIFQIPVFYPIGMVSQMNVDFWYKFNELIFGNSILFLMVFLVGCLYIVFNSKYVEQRSLVCVTFVLLLFYFSPLAWSYRIFGQLAVFMAYVSSFLVYQLYQKIGIRSKQYRTSLIVGFLFVVLLFSLAYPVYYKFSARSWVTPSDQIYQTSLSPEEFQIASVIKNSVQNKAMLISDYFSMWTISPLTNSLTPIQKLMSPDSESAETLSYIKNNVFLAPDGEKAYFSLLSLKNRITYDESDYINKTGVNIDNIDFLVLVSRRTSSWIKHQDYIGFTFDLDNSIDNNILKPFYDKRYFELIYSVKGEIYLFKAKPNVAMPQHTPKTSLSFNGATDVVSVPHSDYLDLNSSFTLEVWLNRSKTMHLRNTLLSKGSNYQFFVLNDGTLQFAYHDEASWRVCTTIGAYVIENESTCVAVRIVPEAYEGKTAIDFFVDGLLMESYELDGMPKSNLLNLYIGRYSTDLEQFNGSISNCRIYAHALDDMMILYNYEHPDTPITSGLVLWFKFDEGVGTILHDSSGDNNDGTIIGPKWEDNV